MTSDQPQRQAVIDQLLRWQADGIPVGKLWLQDRHFLYVAIRTFGSWRAALEAAGMSSARPRWTKARVIEQLRRRQLERKAIDCNLYGAAKRHFGSLEKAYAAAGVPWNRKRKTDTFQERTREQIITAIRARLQRGSRLSKTWQEDVALYAAAKRYFGDWSEAVRAAGIALRPPVKRFTADEVIEQIRKRQQAGLPLTNVIQHDPPLDHAAREHFGGWRNALLAAGVPTKVPRHWSKRAVVEAMREWQRQGRPLSKVWREDKSLFRAAVTHFGGWENAMLAAGFEPRPRERWSKRRVLERLQVWDERCGGTNLRSIAPNLSAAAARLFGSYQAALDAADLEPPPRRWTDRRVLTAIQDRYVAGRPLHIEGLGDLRLALAAKRRFGSWQAAVNAAGLTGKIPIKKPLRRWTPEEVIEEIQAWHASGRRLTEISNSNQSLYNAAKAHFGTWSAARSAAGFEPARRSWSKQAVIDEIRARASRGESLSSGQAENLNLAAVAYRYFGSWRKAIAEAGVPPQPANRKRA